MAAFSKFEDIEAWQKARALNNKIYELISEKCLEKDFTFKDQIKRAGYSIMNNIAEGFERDGNSEFRRFLSTAKGSAGEVKSMLYIALDRKYLDDEKFKVLYGNCTEIGAMIHGLIKYLSKTVIKGTKLR